MTDDLMLDQEPLVSDDPDSPVHYPVLDDEPAQHQPEEAPQPEPAKQPDADKGEPWQGVSQSDLPSFYEDPEAFIMGALARERARTRASVELERSIAETVPHGYEHVARQAFDTAADFGQINPNAVKTATALAIATAIVNGDFDPSAVVPARTTQTPVANGGNRRIATQAQPPALKVPDQLKTAVNDMKRIGFSDQDIADIIRGDR